MPPSPNAGLAAYGRDGKGGMHAAEGFWYCLSLFVFANVLHQNVVLLLFMSVPTMCSRDTDSVAFAPKRSTLHMHYLLHLQQGTPSPLHSGQYL